MNLRDLGDSLEKIAKALNVPVDALLKENK